MDISENPIAQEFLAVKLHIELMAYSAMRAVAANQPGGLNQLLAAIRMNKRARNAIGPGLKLPLLHLPLDPDAKSG